MASINTLWLLKNTNRSWVNNQQRKFKMTEWAYLFKTGIALFAIVNPIGNVPVFISATNGWPK